MTDTARMPTRIRYLLASTGVSVTGDGILLGAAPLLAAALTRNPIEVAAVSAAGYAAWLAVGLPAGVLVDRWPRRRVMVAADLGRAAVLAALVALIAVGRTNIWALIAAVFLIGVGSCFFDPAAQATIPALVSRDRPQLDRANGRLWSLDTFGRSLAGPPLGSALFAAGRALPFLADAVSFLVSAVLVSRLPRHVPEAVEHSPIGQSIRDGVAVVWRTAQLREVTAGMIAYNTGYNIAFATLVLYAQDVLHLTSLQFGLLLAAAAVGGIIAGPLAPRLIGSHSVRRVYAVALMVQAIAWTVAAVAPSPWLVAGGLVAIGTASTTVSVAGGSTRQQHTPDGMLGRITAVTRLVGLGCAAVSALIGGVIANAFGLHAPFVVAAVLLAVSGGAFWRR